MNFLQMLQQQGLEGGCGIAERAHRADIDQPVGIDGDVRIEAVFQSLDAGRGDLRRAQAFAAEVAQLAALLAQTLVHERAPRPLNRQRQDTHARILGHRPRGVGGRVDHDHTIRILLPLRIDRQGQLALGPLLLGRSKPQQVLVLVAFIRSRGHGCSRLGLRRESTRARRSPGFSIPDDRGG
ncbi:MAG: hypothetical protein ACYC3R_07505 [Thiomonas delicata]